LREEQWQEDWAFILSLASQVRKLLYKMAVRKDILISEKKFQDVGVLQETEFSCIMENIPLKPAISKYYWVDSSAKMERFI